MIISKRMLSTNILDRVCKFKNKISPNNLFKTFLEPIITLSIDSKVSNRITILMLFKKEICSFKKLKLTQRRSSPLEITID